MAQWSFPRIRGRVERICASGASALTMRLGVLEEIRRAVGFDAYAWLLTDPTTTVGSAPLADVPVLPDLPRLIRLKYLTEVNRWTELVTGKVTLLRHATDNNPTRSLLYREVLADLSVIDMASAVFRDRFGCWGWLDLWRLAPAAPFSAAEAEFLSSLAAAITTGLRRAQADTFVAAGSGPTDEHRQAGPLVLLLGPDLRVLTQTPQTHEYLRVLVPSEVDRPPIPASAYNVAAQLLAVEARVDAHPPSARVHLADGMWLTLRAARIGAADIAVTIEQSSPAERVDLFTRAFGCSPRERELVGQLVSGRPTRDIARQMFLSEHTVQDHLKSIFAKTSVRNRGALVSRALGT